MVQILKSKLENVNKFGTENDLSNGDVSQGSVVLTFEAESDVSAMLLKEQINTGSIKYGIDRIFRQSGICMEGIDSIEVTIRIVIARGGKFPFSIKCTNQQVKELNCISISPLNDMWGGYSYASSLVVEWMSGCIHVCVFRFSTTIAPNFQTCVILITRLLRGIGRWARKPG